MMKIKRYFCLLFATLFINTIYAQSIPPVTITNTDEAITIKSGIECIEDAGHKISPDSVFKSVDFKQLPDGIPNKNFSSSVFWFKLKVKNETNLPSLILKLSNPALDSIDYYEQMSADSFRNYRTGLLMPFSHREYLSSDYLFLVSIQPHQEKYIYLRIYTSAEVMLPVTIGTQQAIFATDKYKDIFWGIYIGIMLAMLLYNCFVYSTTSDDSYLFYIAYVLAVVVTQISISGYAFQLLWPDHVLVAKYSRVFNTVLAGLTAIGFIRHFLKTKTFFPKADKIFGAFIWLYLLGGILGFSGMYKAGLNLIDMTASAIALYILAIGIITSRKGYRPAVFLLIAWIVFLSGVFIFVFKNFGILPYNNFTVYTMPIGSAMEVLLLSFALADRINILKKEVVISQAKELMALQENERIIQEQNIVLESRVNERTYELVQSNESLNKALVDLKDAELHLVESEKMASLGLLTAGIAHEINNPINFVTSNIMPLNRGVHMLMDTIAEIEKIVRQDIPDEEKRKKVEVYKNEIDLDYLKEEIDQLLVGIEEGASRTSEIVKGLRVFSRLDENDLKNANINYGLDATLVISNNLLNNIIKVEKNYADLPLIECYPGKLNQVFMNIISNAIYAIKKKFGESAGGVIAITTLSDKSNIIIKIADNGVGIDTSKLKRIFEPFFTTKGVGEGVGLGLSIAFNTIKQHDGQIQVQSKENVGTEFIITLPLARK